MRLRDRRALLASALAHAILVASAARYVQTHRPRATSSLTAIDLELIFVHAGAAPHPIAEMVVARPLTRPAVPDAPAALARTVVRVPEALEPVPTHESTAAVEPPNPEAPPAFTVWNPAAPHHTAAPATMTGTQVLESADTDATHAALRGALQDSPGGGGAAPTPNAAARDASDGYVRRAVDAASSTQIPGSWTYYHQVVVGAQRAWHPVNVPTPSLAQTAVNTFFTSRDVAIDATRRSLGPLAEGRSAVAAEDVAWAHPNSPMLQPRNTMAARADATARITHVEIEVNQDAQGRITSMRVVQRSGVTGFDNDAMSAIRAAIAQLPPPAITGTWQSHWDFSVAMSRDPLISALPGLPGEAALGLTAEVTSDGEVHLPGRSHQRRSVRLMSSRLLP